MEKQARVIIFFALFLFLCSFASAKNATINASGSILSPDLELYCNISGFGNGVYQYALFKDGINISSGQFNNNYNASTAITAINQESSSSSAGSWVNLNNAIDENWATFGNCLWGWDDCYVYETYNFSYTKVNSIRWIYKVTNGTYNLSMPNECNKNASFVTRIFSDNDPASIRIDGRCYNGTAYNQQFLNIDLASNPLYSYAYEGSIEVNHSTLISTNENKNIFNYSVVVGGDFVFSCRLTNFTTTTAWSNSSVFSTGIFNFSFYDEQTGKPITQAIQFYLTADDFANNYTGNYTVTGGFVVIHSLGNWNYRVSIDSNKYGKRNYFMPASFVSQANETDIYLLLENQSQHSIIRVIDEYGYAVENAVVYIYRNIVNVTGEQVIGIQKTNFEGEFSWDFVRNTDDYRFIVYSSGGVLLKTTGRTTIDKDVIKIQVVAVSDPYDSFKAYLGATTRLWITNGTTSNRTGNYYFSGSSITYGCIRVRRALFSAFDETVCESCLTASAGVVTCDYNYSNSGTYFVAGYVHTNTVNSEIKTDERDDIGIMAGDRIGRIGLFVAFLLYLCAVLLMRNSPVLSLMFGAFALVILSIIQIILLPVVALISIVIYMVFKGVLISKK